MKRKLFAAFGCACSCLFAAEESLSLTLFKDLVARQEGSVLYSPACLEESLLQAGKYTAGETLAELHALRFGVRDTCTSLKPQSAYALFAAESLPLKKDYADVVRVPFEKDTKKAVQQINDWFMLRTEGAFPRVLAHGDVSADTRLLMVSALSLSAGWVEPFNSSETLPDYPYTLSDGTVVHVPMMVAEKSETHYYAEGEGWQALLTLLVPDAAEEGKPAGCFIAIRPRGDVREFVAGLSPQLLGEIYEKLLLSAREGYRDRSNKRYTDVKMPRFSIQTQSLNMIPLLRNHGLCKIFSAAADWSRLTSEQGIYLASLVQDSGIEVHEKGFSAVSVTRGGWVGQSEPTQERHFSITFDKPFLFIVGAAHPKIRPYFMGICENPAEAAGDRVYVERMSLGCHHSPLEADLYEPVAQLLEQSELAACFEGEPSGPCFSMQHARKLKPGTDAAVLLKPIEVEDAATGNDLEVVPMSRTYVREGGKLYAVLQAEMNYNIECEGGLYTSFGADYACLWFEITEGDTL